MQDYNTIIGSIQMRLNGCQTRSVMDRYKIGSGTLNHEPVPCQRNSNRGTPNDGT